MAGAVVASFGVILAGPAEGAEFFFGEADGVDQVIDAQEGECREVQLLADVVHYLFVRFAIWFCGMKERTQVGVYLTIGRANLKLASAA